MRKNTSWDGWQRQFKRSCDKIGSVGSTRHATPGCQIYVGRTKYVRRSLSVRCHFFCWLFLETLSCMVQNTSTYCTEIEIVCTNLCLTFQNAFVVQKHVHMSMCASHSILVQMSGNISIFLTSEGKNRLSTVIKCECLKQSVEWNKIQLFIYLMCYYKKNWFLSY